LRKKKSLKKRTLEYARKIHFYKMSLVKKRLKMYDNLEIQKQKSMICPKCGNKSLYFEGGSYEENYGDGVYCDYCNFVSDITEDFESLRFGNDFDVLLWFSIDIDRHGIEEVEKEVGCSWNEFCTKTIFEEDVA
jgi:hypothetical protein